MCLWILSSYVEGKKIAYNNSCQCSGTFKLAMQAFLHNVNVPDKKDRGQPACPKV